MRSVLAQWAKSSLLKPNNSSSNFSSIKIHLNGRTRLKSINSKNFSSFAQNFNYKNESSINERSSPSLFRQNSSQIYSPPSIFDSYQCRNPSLLDKFFKCDMGMKQLNKLSLKNHRREDSLNSVNRVELSKDPSALQPLFGIKI